MERRLSAIVAADMVGYGPVHQAHVAGRAGRLDLRPRQAGKDVEIEPWRAALDTAHHAWRRGVDRE